MQVTATLSEGLKREFRVVVPVTDLAERAAARLDDLKGRVNINGFRPGKVPTAHLKKLYGKAVLAETIEALVGEANQKIVEDNGFKLAQEPSVKLPEAEADAKAVFDGQADLDYTVAFEVLPTIQLADFKGIKVEKPVVEPSDADIQSMLETMAKQNRPFEAKADGAKAEDGDRLTIGFVGTIDGEKFDGGTAEDIQLELGSKSFIPGFEDQLVGVKAGEEKTVKVKFPTNYMAQNLAGKDAEFAVTVKSIEAPGERAIDEEFAKMVGFEDLAKLRAAVSDRLKSEYVAASRRKVKRSLLDALDERHSFDLPQTLVDQEFDSVWRQVTQDMEGRGKTFADEDTTEEKSKDEYRKIAERRVRLGLVLAEIGEKAQIKVSDEEVSRAVVERARQFPGQEQQVWDYYRKNAQALASLRAPIFEEKVVDYILELADVTEKTVSKDDLFKDNEDDEAA
ncbi:MAG: trigger factor [Phreatobacter sp.]|uniref:trigger factor n=1 Tax=Phreatobacter sp. TaxID=1966341 RepID=UPI001A497780|nr:trigger factor [Phreatobacter sp.]MBL8569989.1 trigger factor [Phreatobacter sp.]